MRLSAMLPPEEMLASLLASLEKPVTLFPGREERSAWEAVPGPLREAWLREAEPYLQEDWPSIRASAYSAFFTEGQRETYDRLMTARTGALNAMLLAECLEGKGRFLPVMVDVIWLLCEQTAWNSPAHHYLSRNPDGPLPDVKEPLFDISAGEAAAVLVWTSHLLAEPLNSISPLIRERIRQEVDMRIITPYLERSDFWWMGFGEREANNWNPWCNSNLLTCMLLTDMEQPKQETALRKYIASLDRYIEVQYEDGGCDEGATYWTHSAGRLFANLELLYRQSGGRIDVYNQPLIRRLGQFVYKMHIAGDYYVNFADGPALAYPDYAMIGRYGQRISDPHMLEFGRSRSTAADIAGKSKAALCLFHELCRLFDPGEGISPAREDSQVQEEAGGGENPGSVHGSSSIRESSGGAVNLPEQTGESAFMDVWLPAVQVMAVREQPDPGRGLYIAAKGGHNDESHNHNDVGQWVLYSDGEPVLIDIGVGTYTRQTFGPDRYDIWTMQSRYHNLPQVNGYGQREGREFRADGAVYSASPERVTFELDLSKAYSPEAGIIHWQRRLDLYRARPGEAAVVLTEAWELNSPPNELLLHYMTAGLPKLLQPGVLLLHSTFGSQVRLEYPAERLDCSWECCSIEDVRLQAVWGEVLYRITLQAKTSVMEGMLQMRFTSCGEAADQ